jgi:hypothetical protein
MDTTIPFEGFYESNYSYEIDSILEGYFQDDHGDVNPAIAEKVFEKTDYKAAYRYAAKLYTSNFSEVHGIDVKFKSLDSPKFYNYTTDRIFCEIELSEVERLYKEVDKEVLRGLVKQLFTSYDGFISHYSPDLDQWGADVSKWDHNQIGTLIEAYIIWTDTISDFDIFDLNEDLGNNLYEFIDDFERLYKLSKYLEEREDRNS